MANLATCKQGRCGGGGLQQKTTSTTSFFVRLCGETMSPAAPVHRTSSAIFEEAFLEIVSRMHPCLGRFIGGWRRSCWKNHWMRCWTIRVLYQVPIGSNWFNSTTAWPNEKRWGVELRAVSRVIGATCSNSWLRRQGVRLGRQWKLSGALGIDGVRARERVWRWGVRELIFWDPCRFGKRRERLSRDAADPFRSMIPVDAASGELVRTEEEEERSLVLVCLAEWNGSGWRA